MTTVGWNGAAKYLLCRPDGGLNDTLCQIEDCWRYAEKYGRRLLIDTRWSGLHGQFADYFEPRESSPMVSFRVDGETISRLNATRCLPRAVEGRLDDYTSSSCSEIQNQVLSGTSIRLSFSFDQSHADTTLLHHQGGGGRRSFHLLERLRVAEPLRATIRERLVPLQGGYHAVHVRNTDYQTDYRAFFEQLAPRVAGKRLLVCSDDVSVIEYARERFPTTKILVSSQLPDTGGRPIHLKETFDDDFDHQTMVIHSLVDLFSLGLAERLYITQHQLSRLSGFSRLARHLQENQHVIHRMLALPNRSYRWTPWRLRMAWEATIRRGGRSLRLGRFATENHTAADEQSAWEPEMLIRQSGADRRAA